MTESTPRILSGRRGLADVARVGGKAWQLSVLCDAGAPVPAYFVVTTDVAAAVLEPLEADIASRLEALDPRDRAAVRAVSAHIRKQVHGRGLSEADRAALDAAAKEHFAVEDRLAVRSSCVGEDSEADSFAGQLDTYLHVTADTLTERVLDCIASAYSERALLYRQLRGLPATGLRTAVIVQRMIDSRCAGVLFTANPTTGDRDEAVVSVGLGLGEGVVSGIVECDTYFVHGTSLVIRDRVIAQKRTRVAFDRDEGRGTIEEEIAPAEGDLPALDDKAITDLVLLGRSLADRRGTPQDIEWAVDASGALHLLQTRPITTLAEGRQTIFDNSNVVESYPGLSSPLTFSFVRLGYEVLFRESSRLFGVSEKVLQENFDVHPNLLAILNGRIYYNITNWYRLFLQLPGMEKAIPAWEKALGIENRFAKPAEGLSFSDRLAAIPKKLVVAFTLVKNWILLAGRCREFVSYFRSILAEFRDRDADSLEPHEIVQLSETWGRALRPRYSVTVVNDFITQQLYEIVGRLIDTWRLGDPISTRNELLCGETGMESVEPVRSILALTATIRSSDALRSLFESDRAPAEVLAEVEQDPAHGAFAAQLREHVVQYGDRTLEELKLETPLLSDHPERLVPALRNYLRGGQNVEAMEEREQAIRSEAEATVTKALRGHPLRSLVFRFALGRLRWGVAMRENLRLTRSRSFGIFKRLYRALGRRFHDADLLANPDDIFYLTMEESHALVRGGSVTQDAKALVALRKKEYAGYAKRTVAGRVVTHGTVAANRFDRDFAAYDDEVQFSGTGCSPGRVTAPVRVVREPDAAMSLDGEILVAAATDPGWVFLMVAAGGLISEKGSVLSHTAIIGRELGIPTVVGVTDATQRLVDGEVVTLDGKAGTVTRPGPDADARDGDGTDASRSAA